MLETEEERSGREARAALRGWASLEEVADHLRAGYWIDPAMQRRLADMLDPRVPSDLSLVIRRPAAGGRQLTAEEADRRANLMLAVWVYNRLKRTDSEKAATADVVRWFGFSATAVRAEAKRLRDNPPAPDLWALCISLGTVIMQADQPGLWDEIRVAISGTLQDGPEHIPCAKSRNRSYKPRPSNTS